MNDIIVLFFTFFNNDYFVVSILHLLPTGPSSCTVG